MNEDFFLYALLYMAEKGLEIPIVLSAGGTVLYGYMISEEKYFDETSKTIKHDQPDDEEHLKDLFRRMPSTFDEVAMRFLDTDNDPDDVREQRDKMANSFLHLKDTHVLLSAGDYLSMGGTFFRCKLRAVDGFWLGRPE